MKFAFLLRTLHTFYNHNYQSYFTTLIVASAGYVSTRKPSQPLDSESWTLVHASI